MQEIGSLLLIYLPKEFFNNKKTKKPLTKVKTVFFFEKDIKIMMIIKFISNDDNFRYWLEND